MVAFGYGARSFLGRLAVVVLFLIALELLSLAAPASGQATLASIIGVVTDTSNSILPGVTVSATGPALQVPQVTAVTNERGEYRLGLPPGTYTLMFELAGFQQVKREGVRLAVGFTATIDQSMSLGTVEETITVSGQSPLVDVTNPATSVDLASDALELLPTTRDGLKAFMAQVPGMRTNLDVGASSMTDTIVIRAYGQQGAPWQMLEGIMFASSGGNGGAGRARRLQFHRVDAAADGWQQRRNASARSVHRLDCEVGRQPVQRRIRRLWIVRCARKRKRRRRTCGGRREKRAHAARDVGLQWRLWRPRRSQ
jgi:hypothetical protein